MRVRIVDEHPLQSVSARHIRTYLRSHGWDRAGGVADRPDVWHIRSGEDVYEVVAPTQASRDFPETVGALLSTLAVVESRSEADIFRDLSAVSFDVQYIRLRGAHQPGTAPLPEASEALRAAHAALGASATSLEDQRPVQPSRHPSRTTELLHDVLAGPTTEGSYVMSMWVPVPTPLVPDEDDVLFDLPDRPFARQATARFHDATLAARAASEEYVRLNGAVDPFLDRVPEGLSANLCEALAAVSGSREQPFELRFAWALDRPLAGRTAPITFEARHTLALRDAARELRSLQPEDDVEVRGVVVRLHREARSGSGEVTISGIVAHNGLERRRRVTVELSEPDYEAAIRAHDQYDDVTVTGSLTIRGTRARLTQASMFTVLPADD